MYLNLMLLGLKLFDQEPGDLFRIGKAAGEDVEGHVAIFGVSVKGRMRFGKQDDTGDSGFFAGELVTALLNNLETGLHESNDQ